MQIKMYRSDNKLVNEYIDRLIFTEAKKDEDEDQPEDPNENEAPPDEEAPEEDSGEEEMPPEEGDVEMPQDEFGGGMGEEEIKDPSEIGRIYELKKIYSRLTTIESYLSYTSDVVLLKLRNRVSQAIELFEVLTSNIKSYTDKMDEIIINYYKFVHTVYMILKKYYDKKSKEEKNNK